MLKPQIQFGTFWTQIEETSHCVTRQGLTDSPTNYNLQLSLVFVVCIQVGDGKAISERRLSPERSLIQYSIHQWLSITKAKLVSHIDLFLSRTVKKLKRTMYRQKTTYVLLICPNFTFSPNNLWFRLQIKPSLFH